jgi:hypothetical protein
MTRQVMGPSLRTSPALTGTNLMSTVGTARRLDMLEISLLFNLILRTVRGFVESSTRRLPYERWLMSCFPVSHRTCMMWGSRGPAL